MAAAMSSSCKTFPHSFSGDEVGYLNYGPDAANVLFHVVNNRHLKKRPMIFTTNIHHQNVRVGIGRERFLEVSSLASIGEILDQFRRSGEERLKAVLDGAVPDGHRQMGLASTGLTLQDQRPSLDSSRPRGDGQTERIPQ
jgi:hypothetical protein